MKTTAELLTEAGRIVLMFEYEEGELTSELEARIEEFVEASGAKFAALRAVAVQAEAQSKAVDAEIARLRRLKSHYQRVSSSVHRKAGEIAESLDKVGEDPNEKGVARWKKTVRADFPEDLSKWPEAYLKRSETVRPDVAGMKKAIKSGELEPPEGFRLSERRYVKFDGVTTPR